MCCGWLCTCILTETETQNCRTLIYIIDDYDLRIIIVLWSLWYRTTLLITGILQKHDSYGPFNSYDRDVTPWSWPENTLLIRSMGHEKQKGCVFSEICLACTSQIYSCAYTGLYQVYMYVSSAILNYSRRMRAPNTWRKHSLCRLLMDGLENLRPHFCGMHPGCGNGNGAIAHICPEQKQRKLKSNTLLMMTLERQYAPSLESHTWLNILPRFSIYNKFIAGAGKYHGNPTQPV